METFDSLTEKLSVARAEAAELGEAEQSLAAGKEERASALGGKAWTP